MNETPTETETAEERLRLWKEQHTCWVTKSVIQSRLLRCSCGFCQAVDGREAAYRVKAEHLKATMPQVDLKATLPQPDSPGSLVGHWLFVRSLTKSKKHQTWACRCILCGLEAQCTDFTGTLLPLTGSLYRKRRRHKERHPEKLLEQKDAENAILGRTSKRG